VLTPDARRASSADTRLESEEGAQMDTSGKGESLMEATGLGLLPGLVGAMTLIVVAMAALLTGSMWAVALLLVAIGLTIGAIVYIVVALTSEGEEGVRLRARIPGLGE
jgi:hypothetical protein